MSPVFAHGQLRLWLLALLAEGPRHGYDLIRDLESTFNGLYSPSAGTVYPRLAKLEDEGLVERLDEGRKAPYRLTSAGRAEVAARRPEIDALRSDIAHTVGDLADEVRQRVSAQTADLRAELKAAAAAARASARPVRGDARATAGNLDLERAVEDFRSQARHAWRRAEVSENQVRQITAILLESAQRIRDVLRQN